MAIPSSNASIDKAWIEKKKDGTQRRITTSRGFHIIDEFYLYYAEDEEDKESDVSFIVWGSRLWRNLQAGYIRHFDIDFYYWSLANFHITRVNLSGFLSLGRQSLLERES